MSGRTCKPAADPARPPRRTGLARAAVAVALACACLAAAPAALRPAAAATDADRAFERLTRDYLARWLERNPAAATRLGLHERDDELFVITQASLAEDRAWYRDLERQLDALPEAELSFEHQIDRAVLRNQVAARILDLEVIRPYERDPGAYVTLVAGSIQSLIDRNHAPLCRRLRHAARRLEQVPEVLRAARVNLGRPPRVYTETAIGRFEGVLELYRGLGRAAADCRDPETQARLAEADTAAVRAVTDFLAFLRGELLARSDGDFAIGDDAYRRKLAAEEMESAPAESLLARGWAEIAATRARMETLAERVAPGAGVRGALAKLAEDHPHADSLVPAVRAQLDEIRAFIHARGILTMPVKDDLRVRATPAFSRGTSFASYDGPGPFETRASQAYDNVTPVEPTWTEEQKRDHLGFFNRRATQVISIHEALPGHHVQGLYRKQAKSRLRQVHRSASSSEGWAHYCEQMMIEHRYGGGDPALELAQLDMALRRLGRLVVGISLHTRGMTVDEAQRVFEEQCYMAPTNAAREARRGTLDPTYLVYTLGKWRILDLRAEVRAASGARYSERAFHDALLRAGPAPIPLVRRLVLRELGLER